MNSLIKLTTAKSFYTFASRSIPWLAVISTLLFLYGLIGGLILAPADFQQGNGFRIMYVHVPSAFLSIDIYVAMAIAAAIGLIWRIKLCFILIRAAAAIGAWMTFCALVTGAIWGKPMWGTWWVWDARLTSELILLFLYCGFIALQAAIPERKTADKAGAILLLVGVVDIPIIIFAVDWWNTLHQGASLHLTSKPSIAPSMLYPLLAMIVAFSCYALLITFIRARNEVLKIEHQKQWLQEVLQ